MKSNLTLDVHRRDSDLGTILLGNPVETPKMVRLDSIFDVKNQTT